jgi:Flp pilus assembly protein TadG
MTRTACHLLARRWRGHRGANMERGSLRHERGEAMVVWCLLFAVLMLPLGGLSVDLWHGIAVQRQLQAAADDAATAGASGIDVQTYRQDGCLVLDVPQAVSLAEANLADQAGLGPLSATDVTVAPNGSEISVVLSKDVRLTLLTLVEGHRPLVVTAGATSEPRGSVPGDGCP